MFILIALIAFVGLLLGILLAKLAKEELKAGKKYFVLLYKIILLVIIVYLLYLAEINILLIGFVFGAVLAYFVRNVYLFLGLALFSSLNIYVGFFIFFFGLVYGTLIYGRNKLVRYVIICLILFSLSSLVLLFDSSLLLAFTAGGLFFSLVRRID